jgi:hypothetical protein
MDAKGEHASDTSWIWARALARSPVGGGGLPCRSRAGE